MTSTYKVLLLSWDPQQCEHAQAMLSNLKDVETELFQLDENFVHQFITVHATVNANLVLYFMGQDQDNELKQLIKTASIQRPDRVIMISDKTEDPVTTLRLSLQLGVDDHLMRPFTHKDLLSAVQKGVDDIKRVIRDEAQFIVMVSPGGGFGCSSISSGLSAAFATSLNRKTLLLDLNFQFGTQYHYHDVDPDKGLKEALEHIDTIDPTALAGYVTKHACGTDILGVLPDQILLTEEIDKGQLVKLINLLGSTYDVIILDLPGHVDALFSLLMERATTVCLVLRQDIRSVNLGLKLANVLRNDLDVPTNRLSIIINRSDSKQPVTMEDISKAISLPIIAHIPNDPGLVKKSSNLGIPVIMQAPKSRISRAFIDLARYMTPENGHQGVTESLVKRLFNRLKEIAA
jgi:pilus assembly protein CpaE